MASALDIASVSGPGFKASDHRCLPSVPSTSLRTGLCILSAVYLCFFLAGCPKPKEEPIWEKVKVGDLANDTKVPQTKFLKTINVEVHVFEIPADNVGELDNIRKKLRIKPLRLTDYPAFEANSFLVRFGQARIWSEIQNMLLDADGQQIAKATLMLTYGQPQTIAVAGLNRPRTVFYTATDGSRHGANVGPGILGLRIRADDIPGAAGVCDLVAYPVFYLPRQSTIRQLNKRLKSREFAFTTAAFGLRMSPGGFVFLAPKEYISDQTALAGLFFSNVQGSLFLSRSKRKPPEYKPAVRVFLLACTRIDV